MADKLVVEEDTEESEEEGLVETTEDSANEHDDTVINRALPAIATAVEHVQEHEERTLKNLEAKQKMYYKVVKIKLDNEPEEDKGEREELERKEEEVKKVPSKGRKKKNDRPPPFDKRYFLHDDRCDDEYREVSSSPDRWTHDLYVEEKQGPRTKQEKERDRYHYKRSSDHRGRRGGYDRKKKRRRDNLTLKATTTITTTSPSTTSTTNITSTASSPATKSCPRTTGGSGTKLLFVKSQTSPHPTRKFSQKQGRGTGSGSGSALLQVQGGNQSDLVKGTSRECGTKPIINVAPPKANPTGSNEAPPTTDATNNSEAIPSSTGGRSKFGLLPTPNPPIAQQQHALSTAQYMAMQQQQQQSYVMPAPAGVMIDSQSNVIPTAASTTNTHAHNQRELGPFQWVTPTVHVTATITYPGHFADGLYGNLLMQQCHNR